MAGYTRGVIPCALVRAAVNAVGESIGSVSMASGTCSDGAARSRAPESKNWGAE
ncbi:MAG: hypothetical protein ABFD54_05385 [Armatimonadota bacterium]|nr:hypothetical protein [bacterium]